MTDRRSFLTGACAATLGIVAPWRVIGQTSAIDAPLDPAVVGSAEAPLPGLTIAPELYPTMVTVRRDFVPGAIIVLSNSHFLYFVTRKGHAIRYGVAVGKAELQFRGDAVVGEMVEWPSWRPTPEMVQRNPGAYARYAEKGMEGGPKNPLGARAIYLHQDGLDTAVRIHGTIEPNSIGKSVSNGCIRMVNAHVIDLFGRVTLGAPVRVV